MASKAEKRKSITVKVEDLDFDNLFVASVPSYLTADLAAKAKTHSDKLKEINHVQTDMQAEFDNLSSQDYQHPCPRCQRSVGKLDVSVQAVGKRFHPECFTCEECGTKFGNEHYIEHSGKLYCIKDHSRLFGAKCQQCGQLITGKIVYALGTTWHAEHLKCDVCAQVLQPGFKEKDGKAFCLADYTKKYAFSCGGCGQNIDGQYFDVLGKRWHPQCYNCQVCHKPFGEKAYPINNIPYCEHHFHEKNGTLCRECKKPVNGSCVRAFERAFHPACFRCTICQVQLTGEFIPVEDRPYCEQHGN